MKHIRVGNDWAIVDDEDYERLKERNWYKNNKGYAYNPAKKETDDEYLMHRAIMQPDKGMDIHHANHNPMDNRKENLSICTHQENLQSRQKPQGKNGKLPSSRYKGVYKYVYKNTIKYKATIRYEGEQKHLGYFDDEMDAALAYDAKAREKHKEFAVLNFPGIN